MLMKRIKLIGFLCGIIIFVAFSCEKNEDGFPYNTCVKGEVVGYEECGEGSLIRLLDVEFGDNILYYDKTTEEFISYKKVIKSPGLYPMGIIFFKARKYDGRIDYPLFLGENQIPCQWLYGPYPAYTVVITKYSQIQCPRHYESKNNLISFNAHLTEQFIIKSTTVLLFGREKKLHTF